MLSMNLREMVGKYLRLREELRRAMRLPSRYGRYVDRLRGEISGIEKEIRTVRPFDDTLPTVWPASDAPAVGLQPRMSESEHSSSVMS